uniref:Ankyrin repeat protein n=1 Tax=uncultured organism TaxID=155900 RepID=A0A1B3SNX3_9ZZZZ|nr:ankyrin repeat protein [uncultured organism]
MAASDSSPTPLHSAAESGDVDQVRELLQQGKYAVNCTDSKGHTPLHYASAMGCLAAVEVLMSEFRV